MKMKILYTLLAIMSLMITCYCYEENQKQYSDEISTLIGILASLAFITSALFTAFALK